MNQPVPTTIEISIDKQSQIQVQSIRSNGSRGVLIIIPIGELLDNPNGPPEKLLGESIFRHLQVIQPDLLTHGQTRASISTSDSAALDNLELAHRLIHLSISRRTSALVAAIEFLLQEPVDDSAAATAFLAQSWPTLRERIATFPAMAAAGAA